MNRRVFGALAVLLLILPGCDSDPSGRREAIYQLKRSGDPASLATIRERLADPEGEVRATALYALVELDVDDAFDLAASAAGDDDSFVRRTAAHCLGQVGGGGSVPILEGLVLEDNDPRVRRAAAEALVDIDDPKGLPALFQALEDPIRDVRLAAIRGVVRRAPEQAAETLASILLDDPEWEIRVQAAAGIGRSGRQDMLPVLRSAAGDPNEFVRAAVSKALTDLGSAPASP